MAKLGSRPPDVARVRSTQPMRGARTPDENSSAAAWPAGYEVLEAELLVGALGAGKGAGGRPGLRLLVPPGTNPGAIGDIVRAARASIKKPRVPFDDVSIRIADTSDRFAAVRARVATSAGGAEPLAAVSVHLGHRDVFVLGPAADWLDWLGRALCLLLDESFTWSEADDELRRQGLEVHLSP